MWPLAKPTRKDAQHPPILQLQKFLGLTGAQDQARARKAKQQPFGAHDSYHYLIGGLVGGGVLLSCRFLHRYRKRRSADQQRRDSIQAALCAQAWARAALAAQSRQVGPSGATGPITDTSNQAETSRQPQAAARQASQGSRTSRPSRPIRAPAFMSNPGGSAATEAYDIYNPPQYQPGPDAARPEERRLSAWEDAWVKDPGIPFCHASEGLLPLRYYGNASCTVTTAQFARQLGIVNENGTPTQAHGGTVRAQGIVPGITVDLPLINIEYQIKGKRIFSRAGLSDQGAQCRWDMLISHNEIQVFEEAGFTFSTRT